VHQADKAITSGDSTSFVFNALDGMLGGWAGVAASILLITSLFAGILAFHNGINRYLHALGSQGSLPVSVARTNRHQAPSAAAYVQTAIAVVLVAPFAILGLDPVLTLFSWFSGLAVAALVALYILCSAAVIAYFIRNRINGRIWQHYTAPAIAGLALIGVLWLVVANFTVLIGGELVLAVTLLLVVPVVFIVGALTDRQHHFAETTF
ncbi:MAG TPA: hypothetical protein VN108_10185, partial [Marmoricola sp.]|nr:hypothetical protein [Marmoricola sp.]